MTSYFDRIFRLLLRNNMKYIISRRVECRKKTQPTDGQQHITNALTMRCFQFHLLTHRKVAAGCLSLLSILLVHVYYLLPSIILLLPINLIVISET